MSSDGQWTGKGDGMWRATGDDPPKDRAAQQVAVVIPTWNGAQWLSPCLTALRRQTVRPSRVIVVDNGSTDGSRALLAAEFPEVDVVALPRNLGFAAAMNVGIRAAGAGVHIAALNNDTEVAPDWLAALLAVLEDTGAGSVASLMLSRADPGRVDTAGDGYALTGLSFKLGAGGPVSAVPAMPYPVFGACAGACLYRAEMLADVGHFDESYFAYMEDVDLALRARLAGWTCIAAPGARVLHAGAGSSGGRVSAFSVRLTTRNLLTTIIKNAPPALVPVMLAASLAAQGAAVIAALVAGRPGWLRAHLGAWAAGVRDAALSVPRALGQRRAQRSTTTLTTVDFLHLLRAARRQRRDFAKGAVA